MSKAACLCLISLALDNYNIDKEIPNVDACNDPVFEQLSLSKQIGVTGTPAIFLSDGTHLPGYLKPSALLKKIEKTLGK